MKHKTTKLRKLGFRENGLSYSVPSVKARFWIKSNRGTDENEIVIIPRSLDGEALKDLLESWCDQFGAWHHGDNVVRYGLESVRS
jgi:hypothetical protein